MVNRRLLRIKILQELYAHLNYSDRTIDSSQKELALSIRRSYDQYHYLLLLLIDIRDYANMKLDQGREKRRPTFEDLNPNTRFVDNAVINQVVENQSLKNYLNTNKLSWVNYPELIRNLWNSFSESEVYTNYMALPATSYETDKKLVLDFFTLSMMNCEMLYQNLEEQSIFWNDEVDYVISMIVKTIKSFKEPQGFGASLMPEYRNEEDKEFAPLLLRKTLQNKEDYLSMVDSFCKNWDLERIAFIDKLILILAISEAIEFPFIPTRVSMNEYIEIAKLYSTEHSSTFVNGLLDKIFKHLKDEKRIVKKGKGLIGEE
jgi:transcription antitermination protein NusB